MHTKGLFEGQRATTSAKRVFILTRSAFAGLQKYGASYWSGDVSANWEEFRAQIPAGLNFCMTGIPYWTTDIAGYFIKHEPGWWF
jgi:alpha-D-xyloside xylohydrolase